MITRLISAASPLIGLDEAKDHLRITHDLENTLITSLVAVASEAIGEASGRAMSAQVWEIAASGFGGCVVLPKSPIVSITSVSSYVDDVLTEATLADYRLYADDDRSWIEPIDGASWPSAQTRPDGTVIRFVAGYTTLPEGLRHATLMMLAHLYANREAVTAGSMTDVPMAVEYLVGQHALNWVAA